MSVSFEAQQLSFLSNSTGLPFDLDRIKSLVSEHMLVSKILFALILKNFLIILKYAN